MRKRTMGTKQEAQEIKAQIKSLAAELGWTQNQLAQKLYMELHEVENDAEMVKFQERFKKDLQRGTTKVEKLQRYLELMVNHYDAKKINLNFKKHIPLKTISLALSKAMKEISKEIDISLEDNSSQVN
jgi:hypothetical protein